MADGKANKEIAAALGIAIMVKNASGHPSKARRTSRTEAIGVAMRRGLVRLNKSNPVNHSPQTQPASTLRTRYESVATAR
jgi:hypothetical protein